MLVDLAWGMPKPVTLLVIFGIVLLLFGSRIPRVARSLGSVFGCFRQGLHDDPGDGKPRK